MSDNSDASVSPLIHKGKRKAAILNDSDTDSDSSLSDIDVTVLRRNGKRKNRIRESDSDSSIENGRKIKRVPRVTSDSESNDDDSVIGVTKKSARVVSESTNSDSDSELSGASDNGFEDNTSDEWESDWISETEVEQSRVVNNSESNSGVPAASSSVSLGNMSDNSDGESEKCPICLLSFNDQEVGTPETCDHNFCADCIQEWSKNVNTCPVDRQTFTLILVRKHFNGKVIRTVSVDVRRPSVDELIQEDPTYCEICGMSDREDRLLLCDGCDLGYHLECLDPPMDTVPIEEWFCSDCRSSSSSQTEDQTHQQPHRRYRTEHRLLPRTSQSERVRATIETNRNNSAFTIDQQSLSSGFEDVTLPGPSHSATNIRNRSTVQTKTYKKKKSRKTKRSKTKRKSTYNIMYEICEITGEKIAVKKKRKYRKRKRARKTKRKTSTRRVVKPKTVKKRLAYHLGMCPPKTVGLGVPEVKVKANTSNIGHIGYQRSQAGIPALHLFGQRDELDYFSESDEDVLTSGGGDVNVLSQIRTLSSDMGAMRRAARRKAAALSPVPPINVNPCDILGSILDSQAKLHSKHSVISVNKDGTLHIDHLSRPHKTEKNNNNDLVKSENDIISQTNSSVNISSTTEIETTQAPMFPGRGGGGNRQPYGFHRGGYRGGDNRYDGGSGSGYNHFHSGGHRGRGGYGHNMFQPRDNNFSGGFVHFHHHGGPPPPFRGRGGPRFPMRRPQMHQPPPIATNQQDVCIELHLDEPMEQNIADDQFRQPEEDVDIYSDIEASTPFPDDEISQSKPVAESGSTLVSQDYNNSGSDDDSGSELIIDDTIKDTDKYDPTQPSADTDSNSEPPLSMKELEPSLEIIKDSNKSLEKSEEKSEEVVAEQIIDVESTVEPPKITQFSTQIVNEAVQQVMKEHMITPTSSNVNDDDEDVIDDNCPNFSIYSSTSIDIAKSTDISVNIERHVENSEVDHKEQENKIDSQETESCVKSKDSSWESGDEWDSCETENMKDTDTHENDNIKIHDNCSLPDENTNNEESEEITSEITPEISQTPDQQELSPIRITKEIETDKISTEVSVKSTTVENLNDDEPLKLDDNAKIEEVSKRESTTPPLPQLPAISVSEEAVSEKEKLASPIKIAFNPARKYQPINKKERVLQLYDDSDWEEWESKNEVDQCIKPAEISKNVTELDKLTEAISEEERSYTPCLDEREPVKSHSDEERNVGVGIGGMDTELISDEERNDMFDESHDMKTISDGDALEINAKESELDMTRPEDYEEGEIIEKMGAKKTQENESIKPKQNIAEDDKKKKPKKKSEKESDKSKSKETEKQSKKPEFKKISKNTKDRNYRDKDKDKIRSKSNERKSKENKENRKEDKKKKERKRDLERYNVRSIIAEKPKKDQFGRDIKSPSRSSRSLTPRRSRSHSWNRMKRRRRRSRSLRRSRSRSASRGYTPRSRSRGKSPRRSRSLRRSRSSRRSRSKSLRRSRSPRNKRYRLEYRSMSRDRDRLRYRNKSRRRSLDRLRNKKKKRSISKTRLRTRTPSVSKHRIRGEWGRNVDGNRRQSFTREWTPSWSRSPTPRSMPRHNLPQSMSPSWTPPLVMDKGSVQPENLTVILTNNEMNKSKKKEKRKKTDKKSKEELKKRKRGEKTPPPSKEVFASGDNILVSVSFNKTNEENAAPTREITGVKRKRDDSMKKKKDKVGEKKKKRAKSPRTKKKNKEVANMKPVAIIDLDRSPFKELTPSPKDIIVLSDSDNCEKEDETMGDHNMMQEELMALETQIQQDSALQSPTANYLNSTGPKTPPEPQVKFLLTSKQTQLRAINNPLHDPNDEVEGEIDPQEELEHRLDDMLHKGPNTPPEPPSSPPSSPDAYDPFDPTKSRSPTPEPVIVSQPVSSTMNTPGDKTESDGDLVDLAVGPLESSQKSTGSLNDSTEKRSNSLDRAKRLSVSPERNSQTLTPPMSVSDQPAESSDSNRNDTTDKNSNSPERNSIGVIINQQVQPQFPAVVKPIIPTPSIITSTPALSNSTLSRTNLFNSQSSMSGTPRIPASVPQRIILPTPSKASPAKMSPLKISPSKPPIKSTPIKPMPSKTMISKLPVPNIKPITPVRKGSQAKITNRGVGQNGNEVIDVDLDFESPYSPGSSDYEDLFEPPAESTKNNSSSRGQSKNMSKSPSKQNTFDALFASSPVFRQQNKNKPKSNTAKAPIKMNKKPTPTKTGSKTVGVKIDEDNLKILDDLPNSAVEMQVKDKFLKKLNRQERVVEEVKLVLKPHYNKKHVTKEQYKDILRRAVPKICHNRSGEINPKKIQNLIEAYVRKARHNKKTSGGGGGISSNVGTNILQPKPTKTTFWS